MEITAKPSRRGWLRLARVVIVVAALWTVALLIPPALGLHTHVVGDRVSAGIHPRGSLVFEDRIAPSELAVGDVITFVPPGVADGERTVIRRVVAIGDSYVATRRDAPAAVDPWLVPLTDGDFQRVEFSLPWLGYPLLLLGAVTVPGWAPLASVVALVGLFVALRRRSGATVEAAPVAPVPAVRHLA